MPQGKHDHRSYSCVPAGEAIPVHVLSPTLRLAKCLSAGGQLVPKTGPPQYEAKVDIMIDVSRLANSYMPQDNKPTADKAEVMQWFTLSVHRCRIYSTTPLNRIGCNTTAL